MKSITKLVLALSLLFCFNFANSQSYIHPKNSDPGFLAESEHFMFFSHFWLNMHHFLYNKSLAYSKSGIEAAIEPDKWRELDESEKQNLETVLKFYAEKMTHEDLRTGDYTYSFKRWVVQFSSDNPLPDSQEFAAHVKFLNGFRVIYSNHFWDMHYAANKKVLEQNIGLIEKYENKFIETLTDLCKAEWQREKIRVDISFNSKRDIPYTTTRPATHIVMDSGRSHSPAGNWLELLLHEASHHLISSSSGFVGGTVADVVETTNSRSPRQLWHAYLFYFTGKVTEDLLRNEGIANYEIYMVRNQVFATTIPFLEKQLPRYLNNEITLAEATGFIIDDFNKARTN